MSILGIIILATVIVSVISLIGVVTLGMKKKLLKSLLFILVGFSAGALMGGAFLHLLPESLEKLSYEGVFILVLIGFCLFFLIERLLKWHHCHKGKCDVHTFQYMNLFGDGVHNFIDGIIIAISFLVSIPFGIITTIAIIAHEVPQEIGDYAVLVYGGFSRARALCYNFLVALTSIAGALLGYFLSNSIENFTILLVPFAAGGFIYISASDLVPELHKEPKLNKSLLSFIFFILGIMFMWAIKFMFEH